MQRPRVRLSFVPIRRFTYSSLQREQQRDSRQAPHLDTEGRTPGFARRRIVNHNASQQLKPHAKSSSTSSAEPSNLSVSKVLQDDDQNANGLVAPVHVQNDRYGILQSSHPSTSILANPSIVIHRQIEMMNVFMGFEQANRYVIMDPQGNHIGYLAEQDHGIGNAMARQAFRTHRSFTAHVFDKNEREVLRFHRPFSWISSRIRVYDVSSGPPSASAASQGTSKQLNAVASNAHISSAPLSEMRVIGEAQQRWAPLRRKYNLFLHRDLSKFEDSPDAEQLTAGDLPLSNSKEIQVSEDSRDSLGFAQFAYVDEPFLSWDFSLLSEDQRLLGSVNRNFVGFAREIFTDTGVYALRMDSAAQVDQTSMEAVSDKSSKGGMTLDQRALMLATAVSIDFDYFSRHSHTGSTGMWPLWIPWGGGAGAGAGAEAGAAGAAGGAASEVGTMGAATEAGDIARGAASQTGRMGESAAAGAGSLAGYDALQRAREGNQQKDDASPQNTQQDQWADPDPQNMEDSAPSSRSSDQGDDFWGGGRGGQDGGGSGDGGDGEGDGGGGGGSFWDDLF